MVRVLGLTGTIGVMGFILGVTLGILRLLSLVERDALASGVTSER